MKKKILFLLLSSCVLLSLFPLNVSGVIGEPGSSVVVVDSHSGGGAMEGGNHNSFFNGSDGYVYAILGYPNWDNGYPTRWRWYSTDDNGTTWGTASDPGGYLVTFLDYPDLRWDAFDAVYDPSENVFHVAWYRADSTSYHIKYSRCTPDGDGNITLGDFETLENFADGINIGGVSITCLDGKPVVVLSHYDGSSSAYELETYWGNAANPTSWDHWDSALNIAITELHAVTSSKILLLYAFAGVDDYLYGRYITSSGFDGAAFEVTSSLVKGYDIGGSDDKPSGYSSVSDHMLDPDLEADKIFVAYVNASDGDLMGAIWDVDEEAMEEEVSVATPIVNFLMPICAKDGFTYFIGAGHRTAVYDIHGCLYQRDPYGVYTTEEVVLDDWVYSSSGYFTCMLSKGVVGIGDGVLFFEYFWNADRIVQPVDAYGDPWFELSADLEDVDDDGADWVFTNWRYYTFNLTYHGHAANLSLSFSVPTSFENVTVGVLGSNTSQAYASTMEYTAREGEPIILGETIYSYDSSSDITTVLFPLWFSDLVLDLWDENDGVGIYADYNGTGWHLIANEFFRIYSKGGFTLNYDSSDSDYAYLLDGGTPFSFHVDNNEGAGAEWLYNEIWYRDVQHMKLMPEIQSLAGRSSINVRYGCDYSLGDGEWLSGWFFTIQPSFVSYAGVFASNVWVNFTTAEFNRGSMIDSDVLYAFYHGSVTAAGQPARLKVWVDFWFSDKNASSVGSARVNAYEFPMKDNADAWLRWLSSNWGVKDDVPKENEFSVPLLDPDNSTIISSESIKMVRYWCNATVYTAGGTQYVNLTNYEAFDFTHSQQLPLTGVSSPSFDETKTPTVGNTGILGALWSMFAGLGSWISENVLFGGLNLWGTFVAFLDSVAGFFGAPKFFTNLFNWLADLFSYLVTSAGYLITILGDIFSLFTSLLGVFLTTVGDIITSLLTTFSMIGEMFGGAYGAGIDIWEYLGITTWIQVAIFFYPLYLIILWDTKGMDAVIQQLTWIFGLLTWVFQFLISVIQFTLHLVERIVESIPVVE